MKSMKFVALALIAGTGVTLISMSKRKQVARKAVSSISQSKDVAQQRRSIGDTRYKTVSVSREVAVEETNFWARQLSEHALFLHLGIEDAPLKQRGLALHKEFERFRKEFNNRPEMVAQVLPLAKKLRAYKVEVLNTLNSGKWIGWIFPLFARHITLELDYFIDKLNGIKYTDQDEIAFWNTINGEHASFAAHLLDPEERDLFLKGDALSQKFAKVVGSEDEMMRQISLTHAKELDEYNTSARTAQQNNQLKSIIHPVLLDHVIREGQRSIRMLDTLQDKEGAIYPAAA